MKLSHLQERRIFKYKVKSVARNDIVILNKDNHLEKYMVTREDKDDPNIDQGRQFLGHKWIKTRKAFSKQEHKIPLHAVDHIEKQS